MSRGPKGYLLAVVCTALAALMRWAMPDALGGMPYLAFYPAVVVAAGFGGLGPGLLAAIGSLLCVDLWFDATPWRINVGDPAVLGRVIVFLVGGLGTCLIAGMHWSLQTQAAVRDSEERLRLAVEATALEIWEYDPRRRRLRCSLRAKAWLGLSPEREHTYDTWFNGLHPDDRKAVVAEMQRSLDPAGRGRQDIEYRVVRADGSVRWLSVKAQTRFREVEGRRVAVRVIGTMQDITERKYAEENLEAARCSAERAKADAEEANRAKDHFLAVLSHELRTPLTPVLATAALLELEPNLDEEMQRHLEVIRRNAETEARLIDDLLDINRINRDKLELDKRPVPLSQAILQAVEVCRPDISAHRLHLDMDLEAGGQCVVEADVARLQQVFWNLLKNAVKFTPAEGRISICCRRDEHGYAVVQVSDTGCGLEREALGRIFKAFEQADRSVTRQYGGLGLGLAICKALVEMHGGVIEAFSEGKGRGATFKVKLPLADRQSTAERGKPSGNGDRKARMRPLRVLLVEDHRDTAWILNKALQRQGHEVQVAGDVRGALELACAQEFDLLVSDLGLPDRSGMDLIRELRLRGRQLPAIALSGYGQEEDIARSHEAGFIAHLVKPLDFDHFYAAIAEAAR